MVYPDNKQCQLCREPDPSHLLITHDHNHLRLCPDCVRRFGVDEWRSLQSLATGQWRDNPWLVS